MKTYSPKPEHIERRWFVLDAGGQVLGRVATEAAVLLRGKHKPIFAPHMDTGDHVVVINADKVELTGNKARDKIAYRHSGYPGGITGVRYGELLQMRPVAAIEKAVRGMLPKNRLGRQMIKKLHVVAGAEHPHGAQKPVPLAVGERPAWEGLPAAVSRAVQTTTASRAPRTSAGSTPAERGTAATRAAKPTSAERTRPAARATTSTTSTRTAAKRSAAKPSGAKGTTAASSTKEPAKKPTAKKTTAKKTTAKKTTAKKATAKKAAAKKTTAKKTTAKKTKE